MATAITPLANVTLGSSAMTVTFSSISGSYRDLYFVMNVVASSGGDSIRATVNSSSTGIGVEAYGNGSSALSSNSFGLISGANVTVESTDRNQLQFHILDYSATGKDKTSLTRFDNPSAGTVMTCTRFATTAAVNSVAFTFNAGASFNAGSTFALYGVSA